MFDHLLLRSLFVARQDRIEHALVVVVGNAHTAWLQERVLPVHLGTAADRSQLLGQKGIAATAVQRFMKIHIRLAVAQRIVGLDELQAALVDLGQLTA